MDWLNEQAHKYPEITAKKYISGQNMILLDNYLGSGIASVLYYGTNIDAAIQNFYDHGCRCL